MATDRRAEFPAIWDTFLQRKTLALGQPLGYVWGSQFTMRADFLEEIVASLIYVDMVSILETGLRTQMSRTKFDQLEDLQRRIDYLAESNSAVDREGLQTLRKRRNDIAHAIVRITRSDLGVAVAIVQAQLEAWGLVPPPPPYEFYAEASALRASERPGWSLEREYLCGVKNGDRTVMEYKYTEYIE